MSSKTQVKPLSGYFGIEFAGQTIWVDGDEATVKNFFTKGSRKAFAYTLKATGISYFEYMDSIEII